MRKQRNQKRYCNLCLTTMKKHSAQMLLLVFLSQQAGFVSAGVTSAPEDYDILVMVILFILLLITVCIMMFLFFSQSKKHTQLIETIDIIHKSHSERLKKQQILVSQLENVPQKLSKNTLEFLDQACINLAQGLMSTHAIIFQIDRQEKKIRCQASYPQETQNMTDFIKNPSSKIDDFPPVRASQKQTKIFLNKYYDLSFIPEYLVYNIEHQNNLFALLVIAEPNNSFSDEDQLFIKNICSLLALHFESKQKLKLERQLFKQFYFDASSHLPNQRSLLYHMKSVLFENSNAALLLIEVANLLSINDVYGIRKGDDILLQLSNRIQEMADESNFVARISQNRFTILCYGAAEEIIISRVRHFFNLLNESFFIGTQKIVVPINGGVSLFPTNTQDPEKLIELADKALQVTRIRNKEDLLFFNDITIEEINRKQKLTMALHQALTDNKITVYYQPFISAHNFSLQGVEALIRWFPEQFEKISPEEYIPLAEESGLIKELGLWVLKHACQHMLHWQNNLNFKMTLAVNVSPKQLLDPQFARQVLQTLQETGFPPHALELEITEMIASQENSVIDQNVSTLTNNGIGFAIDDFGSGYASFNYIRRFTTRKIKIDRKFIENIEKNTQDANLVKMIVEMGHTLQAKVTAEGVSTLEQLSMLKDMGCDYIQGYLISYPLSSNDFEQFLAQPFINENKQNDEK